MRILRFTVLALAWLPAVAAELRLSVGSWQPDVQGHYRDNDSAYDFERDLAVRARKQGHVALEIQRKTGADVALAYTRIATRGRNTVSSGVPTLPLLSGSGTTTLDSTADFDDLELLARWPLSRGTLRVSPGVAIKHLEGQVLIFESGTEVSRDDVDVWFPELHLHADWRPWPALRFSAGVQGLAYDGDRAREWQALADVTLGALRIEGGWQEKRYDLRDGDNELHARLRGPLFRAGFAFGSR